MTELLDLCYDVLIRILEEINPEDLAACAQTSSGFNEFIKKNKRLYKAHYLHNFVRFSTYLMLWYARVDVYVYRTIQDEAQQPQNQNGYQNYRSSFDVKRSSNQLTTTLRYAGPNSLSRLPSFTHTLHILTPKSATNSPS